jgi:hypothetical protein
MSIWCVTCYVQYVGEITFDTLVNNLHETSMLQRCLKFCILILKYKPLEK